MEDDSLADIDTQNNPVEVLAVEFVENLRQGHGQTIEQYAQRHVDLADDIRSLFPTIVRLEQARAQNESSPDERCATLGPTRLARLGDLRIIREIGRGGMGIVYEAEQESLHRHVAVKVLPRQALLDEKQVRRFEREARTAANLHHTNIVPVLGVGEYGGFRYLVMQFIRGVSLDKIVPHIASAAGDREVDGNQFGVSGQPIEAVWLARALIGGQFGADFDVVNSDSTVTPLAGEFKPRASTDPSEQLAVPAPTVALDHPETGFEPTEGEWDPLPPSLGATKLGVSYWTSVARIGLEVSNALHYAHQHGTLHRDIKPANLILDSQGTAWVADFGLAKAIEHGDASRSADIVGTLKYMAPEQFSGQADARSDLFSLGLTLYELLTLRSAYSETECRKCLTGKVGALSPPRLRRINPSIPRDLETIVLKSIAPEAEHRYQSAGALASDLERFLDGRPIDARRIMPWERLWRWTRRNPALAVSSAAALALLCAVALVSTVGYLRISEANIETGNALDHATAQRQLAEANAALAISALDRIFERFAPTGLPRALEGSSDSAMAGTPVVLSNEAADLLEELVAFYKQLREQYGDDSAYQERIALANRRLGDIDQRLGRYEQAETAYRRALEINASLATASPSSDHKLELAGLYTEIGNTYYERRRFGEARGSFGLAAELLESLVEQHSGERASFELARVYYLLVRGNSLAPTSGRGNQSQNLIADRREARHKLHEALQRIDELAAKDSANPAYAHLRGLLYLEAASFDRRDAPAAAADYLDTATTILESLDKSHTENPEFGIAFCVALSAGNARDRELNKQKLEAFATRLTRARLRVETLVDSHPQVPSYREFQAAIHHKLGTVIMRLGLDAEAETNYTAAIECYHTLATRFPDLTDYYKLKRAFAQQSLAGLLLERDDRAASERARDELLAGITTMESIVTNGEDQATVDARVDNCYQLLARAYRQLGESTLAAEALRQSHPLERSKRP